MDTRYNDQHVRADPSLRTIAEEYLASYTGSFEFLLSAKRALALDYGLNVPAVRGVLNCMLSDGNVVNMPTPPLNMFDAAEYSGPPSRRIPFQEGDPFAEPAQPRPKVTRTSRPPIRLPVRWNMQYGISNHVQAKAIHVLDKQRSQLIWYGPRGAFAPDAREYIWTVYWACSAYGYKDPLGKVILLNVDQAVTAIETELLVLAPVQLTRELRGPHLRQWKWCAQCIRMNGQA